MAGRTFARIHPEDLRRVIKNKLKSLVDPDRGMLDSEILDNLQYDWAQIVPESDIKIEVDFENVAIFDNLSVTSPKYWFADEFDQSIAGFRTLGDFTYFGLYASGDWEYPVFFVYYWDGKELRCYTPRHGNRWNTKIKAAYGNDEEADIENASKLYPSIKDAIESGESPVVDELPPPDSEIILMDIRKRFNLRPDVILS